jgi:branched-chain amino acid transport system permease protein
MIGENEEAAVHVGVNTSLFKILGFAISAMCMGFVGGSFAIRLTYTNPTIAFDTQYSFMPAVMTMLGGGVTVFGPIIGSIFLSLIWEYLQVAFPYYFLIILGSVLILIVMFMPNGIMGIAQKLKLRLMGRKEPAKAPKTPP